MTIRVWDYKSEFETERDDIMGAVERVFSSGQLILGESVRLFEKEFAAYHGLRHTVGVDNGTNAVKLGLQALGVGPGDEVITVSNTAAPTVVAIDSVGATPVFVDVHEGTHLMDTDQVEAAVTQRTKCLLPVHLYGQSADMAPLRAIADRHGLRILEDCAQAHAARHHGVLTGTFGDAAAYSFYPTKVLGAYGDGGAVVTDDDEIAGRLRRLRYYGMDRLYYVYVVRHPRRDDIIERLKAHDIHLNISYPWPVHTMTGFDHLGYRTGDLPVTESLAGEVFSLPMYPSLSPEVQDQVISAVHEVMASF